MIKNVSLFLSTFLLVVFIVTSCGGKKINEVLTSDDSLKINDVSSNNEVSEINEVLTSKEVLTTTETSSSDEVVIGNQVWMNKNLDVDKFRNGDPIPQAQTASDWIRAGENGQPAWCYFDEDPSNYERLSDIPNNGEKYGKLYNWFAVNDPRGLAQFGWHVPSDQEWKILKNHLGGEEMAGSKLKSTTGWIEGKNGTNSSGFSAVPGGGRRNNGTFINPINHDKWWSSTEYKSSYAISHSVFYDDATSKTLGFSVRLIKD